MIRLGSRKNFRASAVISACAGAASANTTADAEASVSDLMKKALIHSSRLFVRGCLIQHLLRKA